MRLVFAVGWVIAASMAAACRPTPRAAEQDAAPVGVSVDAVTFADVAPRLESGGVVQARATSPLASRVIAPIVAIHVRPGDRVRRGAPLVTLDGREIQANKARAAAASLAATASARAAEADVSAAESTLGLARTMHDRMSGLHAKRSATTQELDQAVAALSAAEAQVAGARSRLAAANGARDAARAAELAADVGATYAVLAAPFDGVIADRRADPGSMAMPGVPLLTVEDVSAFRLETQVDEARAHAIAVGQKVDVRLDATGSAADEWIRDARVVEVARVDPVSHTFLIKIDLPPGAASRSGLFGRARFAGPARRSLTAAASALLPRGQLTFVYVVDSGRARLRPVSIGVTAGDRVEVLSGLREGELVIVTPPSSLSDGARVTGAPR